MVTVTLNNPTPTVVSYPDATEVKITGGVLLISKPGSGAMSGAVTVGLVPLGQVSHVEIAVPEVPHA